ncbi:MAG: hypothetical protein J6S05_05555 [Bacteroidaceae bacterium]|nr:hypothetical protein [Bacteroidaceae bacterium]
MKNTFEPVPGVIRVQLRAPFEKFYCLIVPSAKTAENFRDFYLMCEGFGVVSDMFGCIVKSDEDAAEIALSSAIDYIDPSKYQ